MSQNTIKISTAFIYYGSQPDNLRTGTDYNQQSQLAIIPKLDI